MPSDALAMFQLDDGVAIITGGCGLLGRKHAEAIVAAGGRAVLLDLDAERVGLAGYSFGAHAAAAVAGWSATCSR